MGEYKATISSKSDSPDTFTRNKYSRGHVWEFDGGIKVPASSSPHVVRLPFSVEEAVDPEEALIASAASCHMLSFLYLAAKAGLNVSAYTDTALGEMAENDEGQQWVAKITLEPKIEWAHDPPTADAVAELHHEAHKICFIANTLRSEIIIK